MKFCIYLFILSGLAASCSLNQHPNVKKLEVLNVDSGQPEGAYFDTLELRIILTKPEMVHSIYFTFGYVGNDSCIIKNFMFFRKDIDDKLYLVSINRNRFEIMNGEVIVRLNIVSMKLDKYNYLRGNVADINGKYSKMYFFGESKKLSEINCN